MSNSPLPRESTPLPWETHRFLSSHLCAADDGYGLVAVGPMRGRIDSAITGMRRADAELILAAVNSYATHQRIAEAARKLLAAEDVWDDFDARKVLREALAELEAK